MPEKRSYVRLQTKGVVTLRPMSDPDKIFKGELVEISYSGFSTDGAEPILPGSVVRFELTTRALKTALLGEAKIVHVREITKNSSVVYRSGAKFMDIEKSVILRILNMIQTEVALQKKQKKIFF